MKNRWKWSLAFAALLVIPSFSALSGQAPATGVTSSVHDITFLGTLTGLYNPDEYGRVCIFCHTSENPAPGDPSPSTGFPTYPYWNHPLSPVNPAPYSWAAPANLPIPIAADPLIGQSRLCLSCHDGLTAVDSHGGDGTANNGNHPMVSPGRTIGDLSVNHPIGFSYADAFAMRGPSVLHDVIGQGTTYVTELAGTAVRGSKKISDQLYQGTYMTCATCHDIHNADNAVNAPSVSNPLFAPNYLVRAREKQSALCISCHRMAEGFEAGGAAPGTPGSGIIGSFHDITYLGSQGFGYSQDDFQRVCIFCHSPHNAQSNFGIATPLSNHADSMAFLPPYIWQDPANFPITFSPDPLVGPSRTCMGCHDGLTAVNDHGPSTGTARGNNSGNMVLTAVSRYFTDLTSTHPIGFLFNDALTVGSNLKPGLSANSTFAGNARPDVTIGSRLYGGYMTCATCHDLHNAQNAPSLNHQHNLLLGGPTAREFCLTCHVTVDSVCAHGTNCAGDATSSFSPTTIDFGSITPGTTSAVRTVTLTNSGGSVLSIPNLNLSGPDAGMFAIAAGGTCDNYLAAGTSCTLNVVFKPTLAGARSATLSVNTAISPAATRSVTLSGTGSADQPTISGTPATGVISGTTYSFTPTATNATGFTIANKPSWASFDPATGTISGTPGIDDVGIYGNIVITAVNGSLTAELPPFAITVTPPADLTVMVPGASPAYFTTLAAGYAAADNGSTILARAVLFVEDLLFDRPVSVKLAGGKNELFQDGSDVTTVQGKLTIRQGTVDISGMRFK